MQIPGWEIFGGPNVGPRFTGVGHRTLHDDATSTLGARSLPPSVGRFQPSSLQEAKCCGSNGYRKRKDGMLSTTDSAIVTRMTNAKRPTASSPSPTAT